MIFYLQNISLPHFGKNRKKRKKIPLVGNQWNETYENAISI